jgi:Secretion system C-terminal sorting domain
MNRKLQLIALLLTSSFGFAQFTTGEVTLSSPMTVKIDTDATTVTLTLKGSSTAWLGIGFGGTSMSSATDMFIWNSTTNRDYTPSGFQSAPSADSAANQSWTTVSDNVVSGVRTVVATRTLMSAGDYTFTNNNSSIPIIYAFGGSTNISNHNFGGQRGITSLTRTQLGVEDFSLNATVIYPNPSNGSFTIKAKTTIEKVDVYTQTGAFVKSISVKPDNNNAEIKIDGLATGVYLLEIQNSTEKSWKKIVVE